MKLETQPRMDLKKRRSSNFSVSGDIGFDCTSRPMEQVCCGCEVFDVLPKAIFLTDGRQVGGFTCAFTELSNTDYDSPAEGK